MNSLLIGLEVMLCFLNAYADIFDPYRFLTAPAAFDVNEMAGDWYEYAIASNLQWVLRYKQRFKMGVVKFKPAKNGDLKMEYERRRDNGYCHRYDKLAWKTAHPGTFIYDSRFMGFNGIMTAVVVEERFMHLSLQLTRSTEVYFVAGLLARSRDLPERQVNKFKRFAVNAGIHNYNIHFCARNDACTPSKSG